ncbi:MAG: prevent-host-death protein [Proteobacteria bacterium HN_bin10]|jgi:prevent-host-death family protein|nr:MAG: prevent-host-death protein [Proteobacteria bacterium HN_bin10]
MIKVGAFEAKTQLSALLDKVEQGEDVVITRHGKPIARLVKAEAASLQEVDAAIARLKERRKGVTAGPGGWKSLRDEGRKY